MAINQVNKEIPQEYAEKYQIYAGELAHINAYQEASRKIEPVRPRASKMVKDLREAVKKLDCKMG